MTAVRLPEGEARAWSAAVSRGLGALRLNQHFPPWQRLAAWLRAMPGPDGVRVDRESGLPAPREWVRLRVDRELAEAALADLATVDTTRLPPDAAARLREQRSDLAETLALDALPAREVHVALRHVEGGRASYLVRVDRFDVATATVARYTLVLADRAGRSVGEGELELRASDAFRAHLELLSTQDAALAFALLRAREGIEVEEVVRGVIGPGVIPGKAGPAALRGLPLGGPVVSACLERASLDVAGGRVDDPLAATVVVPGQGEVFGISRQRKWAAPRAGVPALKAWLEARGSRNIVYGC